LPQTHVKEAQRYENFSQGKNFAAIFKGFRFNISMQLYRANIGRKFLLVNKTLNFFWVCC
jgi:hypothetical protein